MLNLQHPDRFAHRHIGIQVEDEQAMLDAIGVASLDELIQQTVPDNIRLTEEMDIPEALSEYDYLKAVRKMAAKNQVFKSYIGMGYYNTITPSVIARNVFENPGWYTQYTPYQAEIAQGRLEALLNFQTMVSDLTGLPIANASLLDEGTAAAEAMAMLYGLKNKRNKGEAFNKFLVSKNVFPQTLDVLATRAEPLGIEIVVAEPEQFVFHPQAFGVFLQYPADNGAVEDYRALVEKAKSEDLFVAVAADLLSLTILRPPGEWGADVVVGNSQRFGVPLGYGGPHAAFFATKDEFKRQIPGRIIGVSKDRLGNTALRMALQTREQHIRRDKATSNICTAQALLAVMASMYAVYHGPDGLKKIAERVHGLTQILDKELRELGFKQLNDYYFDTLFLDLETEAQQKALREVAEVNGINLRYELKRYVGISLDETTDLEAVCQLLNVFENLKDKEAQPIQPEELAGVAEGLELRLPEKLIRESGYLEHPVFHQHRSESQMMRYIKRLENKDLSLVHSMISLGSCTMKLNAATELIPVSWPEFSQLHPFVPVEQAKGYRQLFDELEAYLCEVTGFDACSLQPNSGAQGEYTGLLTIRAYHLHQGNEQRNVALIPSSAHGTNPASAVMTGMKVVVVKCDDNGNIDLADLKKKVEKHSDKLAALMVTYPSTHGVFEVAIQEICEMVHENGGLVYMDGANMNAQVGLTSPARIGADVCHLNLHKTFAIPHGGGGPGMGPICVNNKLKPFLPTHPLQETGGEEGVRAVSAAAWGSASILLISHAYTRMLGKQGLTDATRYAILNANYIKARLEEAYPVLYTGEQGRAAHELILDLRQFKKLGVEAEDIAKRLIDYGFHAPTLAFPVPGTVMIEPTESEDKAELDRFCDAMLQIRQEIDEIANGDAEQGNNVLSNAPHTEAELTADSWSYPYSREKAAFPLEFVRERKFWATVARVNNTYGDKNLICTCPPLEAYETEEV